MKLLVFILDSFSSTRPLRAIAATQFCCHPAKRALAKRDRSFSFMDTAFRTCSRSFSKKKNNLKMLPFGSHVSDFSHMACFIKDPLECNSGTHSQHPVKYRHIFIKIGLKNDEFDTHHSKNKTTKKIYLAYLLLLDFWVYSDAKVRNSCRSRKML